MGTLTLVHAGKTLEARWVGDNKIDALAALDVMRSQIDPPDFSALEAELAELQKLAEEI